MSIEVKLPELGENVEHGDVVNVLVSEGETVTKGQNIVELETDKAVVEVPSTATGQVVKVLVKKGDRVKIGEPILTLEAAGDAASAAAPSPAKTAPEVSTPPPAPASPKPAPAAPEAPRVSPAAATSTAPVRAAAAPTNGHRAPPAPAGPSTRRMARKLGVDLHQVSGSGRGGRITSEDIEAFVRGRLSVGAPAAPSASQEPPLPDFAQWGAIERQKLSGIRRKTAENMGVAWQVIPHVTQFDSADITDLEAARRDYQAHRKDDKPGKVTVTILAMKACLAALKAMPQFNSSLDLANDELILKRHYHIGVAVDTKHGLLVPVVRDVERKTIPEIAAELHDLAARARERKVGIDEMLGGTFTISNLGGIGGTGFTPIVNYPQVAILGIARARQEQIVIDGKPEIRLMMPVSLSYDHRVIDGADGARFLSRIVKMLADPFELLLGL